MRYLRWIWTHMAGIRWNTLARILTGITQVLLSLLMIWLSKQFIDVTIRTGTHDDVLRMIAMLATVVVTAILLRQLYYYMSVTASVRQTNSIRLRVFSNLFRRQLFEDPLHSGDVTSRLSKDIDTVAQATTTMLPQAVVTTCQLAGAFLLLASMDRVLAVILLFSTPVFIAGGKLLASRLRKMTLEIRQQESVIQMQVQEGMEHNATIRSLGSEQWMTERLDDMQDNLVGRIMRRTRFTVVTRLLMGFTFSMGYLLAFVWGGLQLRSGAITFGVMTSFLQLVSQLQSPILGLLNMMPQFFHASASIDRIDELEQQGVQQVQRDMAPIALAAPAGLRIENVTFGYATGDRNIVDHFSHLFAPGSKTAILGRTGAGKTTFFRLLMAFVTPQEGRLTVYNHLDEIGISERTRCNFVFVPQGNSLMSGTIRYNLQLARPEVTDDELRQVLHVAMADFVFDLPDGLDTQLGERGSGLSEGQAQRIAIARGLLRPGNILLLDEISSSLDEQTERELYTRLFSSYADKTMIFITHRKEVCSLCDEIVTF